MQDILSQKFDLAMFAISRLIFNNIHSICWDVFFVFLSSRWMQSSILHQKRQDVEQQQQQQQQQLKLLCDDEEKNVCFYFYLFTFIPPDLKKEKEEEWKKTFYGFCLSLTFSFFLSLEDSFSS